MGYSALIHVHLSTQPGAGCIPAPAGPWGWGEDGCVELRSAFIFSPVAPAKATGFCFWSLISRRGEDSDDNFIHHTEKDRKRREIPGTKEDSRPRLWQDGDHSAGVIS